MEGSPSLTRGGQAGLNHVLTAKQTFQRIASPSFNAALAGQMSVQGAEWILKCNVSKEWPPSTHSQLRLGSVSSGWGPLIAGKSSLP